MLCRVGEETIPYIIYFAQPSPLSTSLPPSTSSTTSHESVKTITETSHWNNNTTTDCSSRDSARAYLALFMRAHLWAGGGGATRFLCSLQTISFTWSRKRRMMLLFVTVCSLTATASYCFMGCKLKSFPEWVGQSTSYECLSKTLEQEEDLPGE